MTPRQRLLSARIAYVAIVLLATLTHLDFSSDMSAASMRLARAFAPSVSWRDAIDGLRNVALFAGLGTVWVLTSFTGKVRREIRISTIISFGLSSLVEGAQVFSPVRNASILDVFTNTIGGLAGAVATAVLLAVLNSRRGKKSYLGIPTMLIAGPYILAVLCEAFTPLFDSSPIPSAYGGPLTRLRLSLSLSGSFDWTRIPALDIPLFGAAGFLLVALARERRTVEEQVTWTAALPLVPVVILTHILHGAVGLPIRWEAAITDSLAIILGAVAADRLLGSFTQYYRGAARARLFLQSYAVLLIIWGWRPLWPETHIDVIVAQLNADAFTPLAGLSQRSDVFSAIHVAQQFLLYLPLGALLAVWPFRRRGPLSHLWPGIFLAIAIEVGHFVILDRTFDITNILLAISGLAMGWIAVRRSGYEVYGEATSPARRQVSRA